jgi:hypothetical protein
MRVEEFDNLFALIPLQPIMQAEAEPISNVVYKDDREFYGSVNSYWACRFMDGLDWFKHELQVPPVLLTLLFYRIYKNYLIRMRNFMNTSLVLIVL